VSVRVPLTAFEPWSPFKSVVWWYDLDAPLTMEEVREALEAQDFVEVPMPPQEGTPPTRRDHARRVAYLAHAGWDDGICVDVGVPDMGCHIIDGNHRLAAAFIRGDQDILVEPCGSLDYFTELFGVEVPP